jgi:hypothetical protein
MRDFKLLLKSLKLRIGEREYRREISSRYTVITFQILKIFRAKIVRVVVLSLSVCVFLCFSHEPHERVSLYHRLSLLDEGFSGAFTNAQSTLTSSSNINFPSMFSIALCASSFSLYSIKQYPLTNPVLRSKFKCKFEISPKSPKFSWTSSSCASSWTPVTRTTQPSMDFCGWPRCPPLSPSPSLKVSYRSFRECFTSSSITSAFSKPRPCGEKYENVALTIYHRCRRGDETHARNGDEHTEKEQRKKAR